MLINKVNQGPIVSTQSTNYIQQEKPHANAMQPFGPAATFTKSGKADYDSSKLSGTQKSIMNIQEQIAQVKSDDTLDEGLKQSRIEALEEQLQNLEMQLSQEQMEKANPKDKEKADTAGQNSLNAAPEENEALKDSNPMNDDLGEMAMGMLNLTQNINQMAQEKTAMGAADKAERHVNVLQSEIKLDRNPSDGKKQAVKDAKLQAQEASATAQKMMERTGEMINKSARPTEPAQTENTAKKVDEESTDRGEENQLDAGSEVQNKSGAAVNED